MLFLQSAGTDFGTAHDLVAAVTDILRAPHDDQSPADIRSFRPHHPGTNNGSADRRPVLDPVRLAERLQRAGCVGHESSLVALSVLLTTTSSLRDVDLNWISAVASRIGDEDILLETAGVLFAFNTINRIADARRVRLEFRFLRELKPIRGWVERRLVSLIGLAYDLSFKHRLRHSPTDLQARLGGLLERLGVPDVPEVFNWLSRSPVVLEGVLEMIEANVMNAGVCSDLLKEAVAIGVASRAMPGSDLSAMVDQWLPRESVGDAKRLRQWAAPSGVGSDSDLVSACRRYAWQVANAAYTITDEQIRQLTALGLSDAELMDLTLATAVFSALAIIEPMSAVIAPAFASAEQTVPSEVREVEVQLA